MKKISLSFLWLLLFLWGSPPAHAQLTIKNGNEQLFSNMIDKLVGPGVKILNASVIIGGTPITSLNATSAFSARDMFGFYTSADVSDIDGVGTEGLLITNGSAKAVAQSSGVQSGVVKNFGGDSNIPGNTFDGCAIKFDVYPIGNEISFKYCFASDEYEDWICSQYNDEFRFLVTGPKPGGGSYTGINIATIPGTLPEDNALGKPVAINSIHQGGPTSDCTPKTATSFPQFHNKNSSPYMVYNERTKNLVARLPVVPCQKYTFYLVVVDKRDGWLDTGVFIQALSSNPPDVNITTNSVIKDGLEGCISPSVNLVRQGTNKPAESFKMVLEGTASFLADYDLELNGVNITSSTFNIDFSIGETTKILKLKPKLDGLSEPTETVLLKLYRLSCNIPGEPAGGEYLLSTNTVNILDKDTYNILENNPAAIIYRCTDVSIPPKLKGVLADAYAWTTVGGSFTCTDPSCREITPATQTTDATYKLSATFGDCVIEKEIKIDYSVLKVNTVAPICTGQSATLIAEGRANYTWSPATGLSCTNCATPSANPTTTTIYTVTATEGTLSDGCSSTAQVTVTVLTEAGPQFVGLAPQYCINDAPITLAISPTGTSGAYTINGSPATVFNPTVLGAGQHEVKFIKAGTPGVTCADVVTKTVLVNALPAITFTVASSVCKNGTPINISANPAGGVFKINGTTITQIDPALYPVGNVTVNYAITDNNTGCLNTSSTVVAIAPLPTYEWVDVLDNYCILDNNEVTPKLRITDTDGTIKIVTLAPFTPSFKGALGELNFNIGASVSGANSCNDIATKAIKINEPVDVQFVDLLDEYCQQALPVTLKANPSGGTFKVNGVATGSLVPMDFAVGDVVRVEYTYSTNGCLVVIEKEVDIVQGTAYTPTTENLIVCPPNAQGYPLEAVPLSQAQAGYKFEWTSTVPALNGQTTRVLYVKEDQTGKHKVLIRDAGNCPIDEITFDVLIKCNTAFFIPTAFTPNGDGKNDMLEIFGADFTKLRMQIYNRWGEVVFTARSKSEGWDGKIKGQPAPAGVYTWKASYESVLQPGTVIEKEGSINLIR